MTNKELMGYAVAGATLIAAAIALYTFVKDEVGDAAAAVGNAVNPVSDKNLAYRAVNGVGAALSGDASWSLGSWFYDKFNPPYDPNQKPFTPRKIAVGAESKVYDYLAGNG